jgi:hypothetical protein
VIKVDITSTGPSLEEMLRLDIEGEAERQLEQVRAAIDLMGGAYQKTGHLKQSLTMRRVAGGAELVAAPDRLRAISTRKRFIELLAIHMGTVR